VADIAASDAYFALEKSIVARKMRFSINDGMKDPFGRTCWSMMIYGCRASEGKKDEKDH